MNRWNNLLGRFTNIYTDNNASAATGYSSNSFSEEFLATECSHPLFLNKYKTQFEALSDKEVKAENNILKIQSLSDHSYRQIWSSLTKEEQFTLYDLAEDGLVNTTNYMSLTMLLNKGLVLKKDGVLILMNRSFRNFVLTVVNTREVKSIEKEISDGQAWGDYKYPVLIILGALIYFVLSSNPEKFGNVLPLISGVMAGIPAVLKLLSFLKPAENFWGVPLHNKYFLPFYFSFFILFFFDFFLLYIILNFSIKLRGGVIDKISLFKEVFFFGGEGRNMPPVKIIPFEGKK